MYFLKKKDWKVWLDEIVSFCESNNRKCYAENAFNEVSDKALIFPMDVKDKLCSEIDNPEDLKVVSSRLKEIENRTVYMCFSADMLHSGHFAIIKKAKKLGRLIIGVLSDQTVASYKRFPLLPFEERKSMFENIAGVYKVVEQNKLSYKENLLKYKPTYVVHGDDWITGIQQSIRKEVIDVLSTYGGTLVEYPYSHDKKYHDLEKRARNKIKK